MRLGLPTQGGKTMLVLTRNIGEKIVIGDNIQITVVAIKGNKVRVGVEAPDDVRVDRQEVHDRRTEFAEAVRVDGKSCGAGL
jgi:carbon storage regulator